MFCNCISIGQFTKLHIVGHNHYANFPHCRIHVNGAGKWKINITKLYGHPFRRLPKCVMNLFDVAAKMTKVVKDIVKVHLLCTALCNCGGDCEHWLFFIIFPCFTENSLKISLNWSYLDFFRFSGCICFCTVKSHRTSKKLYLLIKLVFKT